MSSSAPNKSKVARAAAILTTSEVAGADVDLNSAFNSTVAVEVDFTLGSLTNVAIRFYASNDGVTWFPVFASGTALVVTLTATGKAAVSVPSLPGYRRLRVSAQGSGTVAGSSLAMTYRYLRRGSQF